MQRFTFRLRDRGARWLSVEDFRRQALKRLPRMLGAYIESVAEDGETGDRNRSTFADYKLLPRALTGISNPDLSVNIGGHSLSLPVMLAPTGLAGLVHRHGEIALARAAQAAGTRMILSTASTAPMEDVGAAAGPGHWFQLYPIGNADAVHVLMQRALAAGFETLVVTVDTPTVGKREAELRNGIGMPVRMTPARCVDLAMHPRWLAGYMRHRRIYPALYSSPNIAASQAGQRFMQSDLSWNDLAWIRRNWPGRLYIKGLLRADDARMAIDDTGANGVILSNHGGRQLGSTIAALEAVRDVRCLIQRRGEILIDGGIRRGSDVVKALCLGADAVLIGRPALYGLACNGQPGVQQILKTLEDEIRTTLILIGCESVQALSDAYLANATGPGAHPDAGGNPQPGENDR